jgi:peptidase C13-like protein
VTDGRRLTAENAENAESGANVLSLRFLRSLRLNALLLLFVLVPSYAVAQQTHVLVVVGVPGDEEHSAIFQKWATNFIDAAKKKENVPDGNITLLSDRKATREGVTQAFGDLAKRAKPSDTVFILLIGHGSFDGSSAAFNLPGPDLAAADYAKLLGTLTSTHVVFVNTSSSSGAFLPAVSAPGRVVVTATKTGGERNETIFPEFFIAAFSDEAADRDRNGHISVAEAFEYAKTKVTQSFQQKGYLLTEHATLDEGGLPNLAAEAFLGTGRSDLAAKVDMSDPAMRALVEERDKLEQEIAALRLLKASMDPDKYDAQMEKLLTDMALKTKAIRDLQAKKDKP